MNYDDDVQLIHCKNFARGVIDFIDFTNLLLIHCKVSTGFWFDVYWGCEVECLFFLHIINSLQDYVYIYDGLPSYVGFQDEFDRPSDAVLLAAVCGYDIVEPISFTASSGYMVVYFEADIGTGELSYDVTITSSILA